MGDNVLQEGTSSFKNWDDPPHPRHPPELVSCAMKGNQGKHHSGRRGETWQRQVRGR